MYSNRTPIYREDILARIDSATDIPTLKNIIKDIVAYCPFQSKPSTYGETPIGPI